jgi:hypothetical protein
MRSIDNRDLVDFLIEGENNLKNLISAQSMYIEFLSREMSKYATTSKYKVSNDDFRTGQELRDQIEEMSAFLEK